MDNCLGTVPSGLAHTPSAVIHRRDSGPPADRLSFLPGIWRGARSAPTIAAPPRALGRATVILNDSYALVPLDRLTEHPENPNEGDADAIAASIDANGFYGAVVAQKSTGHVLAGNHRLIAARQHGLDTLPVVWLDVDDDRARRILLADNRTAELAHRDPEALAGILTALNDTDEALRGTGYAPEDLEDLLALIAGPPDLDALAAAWDDREPSDGEMVIRVSDPGTIAGWRAHRAGYDTDTAALGALLPAAA